jgi:hypothetical protein
MESEGKDEYDIRKQVGQEIDGKFYKAIWNHIWSSLQTSKNFFFKFCGLMSCYYL